MGNVITERPDPKVEQILSMVVMPPVTADSTATEVLLQEVQDLHAARSLNHGELRLDLPAEATRAVPEDRNAEAPFAVDEADDPLLEAWPFLLIVRTGRIFTAHSTQPTKAV